MRSIPCLTIATLVGLLQGCGGGVEAPAAAPSPAPAVRLDPMAAAAAASVPAPAADTILAWAERVAPELFPAGAATQTITHESRLYTGRYYPQTGNHLALVNGGTIYGLGGFTNGEVRDFGSFEAFLCQASPAECAPRPTRVLRVRIDAGSLQCEPGSGIARLDARRRLTEAGIAVAGSDCGYARFGVPAVCGAADARYWMFDIDAADAARANALGFLPIDKDEYPGTPSALACSY